MKTRTKILILAAFFAIPVLVYGKAKHQVYSEIAEAKQREAEMLEAVEIDRLVSKRVQLLEQERQAKRIERVEKLQSELETFVTLSENERSAFLDQIIDESEESREFRRSEDRLNSTRLFTHRVGGRALRADLRRHLPEFRQALLERREQRGLNNS